LNQLGGRGCDAVHAPGLDLFMPPTMLTFICIFPTNVPSTLMGHAQIDR